MTLKLGDSYIETEIIANSIGFRVHERENLRQFEFDSDANITVGRSSACLIRVDSSKVSTMHGLFEFDYQRTCWMYYDKGSRNGSWLALHTMNTIQRGTNSPIHIIEAKDRLSIAEKSGNDLTAKVIYISLAN
mmetsp:Transcript_17877/g.32232  ORF Transcript_17877/g.32232 Transcript_17877/m.32232 type:complete len:133 (+) Transcript_17877:796-1194(+)